MIFWGVKEKRSGRQRIRHTTGDILWGAPDGPCRLDFHCTKGAFHERGLQRLWKVKEKVGQGRLTSMAPRGGTVAIVITRCD
jgi:hypothetical protein